MKNNNLLTFIALYSFLAFALCGCVERRLTVNTTPQGALIFLNDEEIGESPATVSFNWYGDYKVRVEKEGFETLNTHRELKAPWYDHFPFDFFAQIISSKRTVDLYKWTFELQPKQPIDRAELIEKARNLQQQAQ